MLKWILLAVVAIVLAEELDSQASESRHHEEPHALGGKLDTKVPGTGVFREIHPSHHPLPKDRIEEQNRIIYDVYSPNYAQPTWFLDYRYLKSGGREYVRGDGGQILILPKGVHAKDHGYEHWGDYDELLEFLRLQELADKEQRAKERKQGHAHHQEEQQNERFYPAEEYIPKNVKVPVGWEREAENERRWQGGHNKWTHGH